MIKRRKSRKIFVGKVAIGGNSPVVIQSMTNTDTKDVGKTVQQIKRLEQAGCELVRVAVEDEKAAWAIARIKSRISIPLIADIHFNYKLALLAIENGADKIRLNPGNITNRQQIEKIITCAKKYKVPIRIGLNSGSVKRTDKSKLADDLIKSARLYLGVFKNLNFNQIVFSVKTPDVLTTIQAYRRMAEITDAPMHLGITASGPWQNGIIKSSIGIGVLLLEGIGDTIRVSLTSDPVDETKVAKQILSSLNLRNQGIEIISCPTCSRCKIDLIKIVKQAEIKFSNFKMANLGQRIKVAIMGCVVNGPGEAKDADIGIAWTGKCGVLFKKGKKVKLVNRKELLKTLYTEVSK